MLYRKVFACVPLATQVPVAFAISIPKQSTTNSDAHPWQIIPPPGRVPFALKISHCGSVIPALVQTQLGNLGNGCHRAEMPGFRAFAALPKCCGPHSGEPPSLSSRTLRAHPNGRQASAR